MNWRLPFIVEVERMTVKETVRICLANLEGIEASLSMLALNVEQKEVAEDLHKAMLLVGEIVTDIKKNVEVITN